MKLNDLGTLKRGKSKHRPCNDATLYGGKYPFIQTGDIKASEPHILSHSQTYNEKGLQQSQLWDEGTLCITIAANIAETAILSYASCFPDSVVGFQPFNDKSDVYYVKYLIDYMKRNMQQISKGTTQDNLSLDKILSFEISTPDVLTQKNMHDHYCYVIYSSKTTTVVLPFWKKWRSGFFESGLCIFASLDMEMLKWLILSLA